MTGLDRAIALVLIGGGTTLGVVALVYGLRAGVANRRIAAFRPRNYYAGRTAVVFGVIFAVFGLVMLAAIAWLLLELVKQW